MNDEYQCSVCGVAHAPGVDPTPAPETPGQEREIADTLLALGFRLLPPPGYRAQADILRDLVQRATERLRSDYESGLRIRKQLERTIFDQGKAMESVHWQYGKRIANLEADVERLTKERDEAGQLLAEALPDRPQGREHIDRTVVDMARQARNRIFSDGNTIQDYSERIARLEADLSAARERIKAFQDTDSLRAVEEALDRQTAAELDAAAARAETGKWERLYLDRQKHHEKQMEATEALMHLHAEDAIEAKAELAASSSREERLRKALEGALPVLLDERYAAKHAGRANYIDSLLTKARAALSSPSEPPSSEKENE